MRSTNASFPVGLDPENFWPASHVIAVRHCCCISGAYSAAESSRKSMKWATCASLASRSLIRRDKDRGVGFEHGKFSGEKKFGVYLLQRSGLRRSRQACSCSLSAARSHRQELPVHPAAASARLVTAIRSRRVMQAILYQLNISLVKLGGPDWKQSGREKRRQEKAGRKR